VPLIDQGLQPVGQVVRRLFLTEAQRWFGHEEMVHGHSGAGGEKCEHGAGRMTQHDRVTARRICRLCDGEACGHPAHCPVTQAADAA